MKKLIILLLLAIPMFGIAQEPYLKSTLVSYVKHIPDNDPEKFWQGLHKQHRQVKAMQRAVENKKASMCEALAKFENIHDARQYAESISTINSEIEDVLALWFSQVGLNGADKNAKLFLVGDSTVNACMYPDGTCLINIGLLKFVENEEEIIGVLAHETAHLALWHALNDKWRTIKAIKRNQMWAEIGTGLAVGAYGYSQINLAKNGVKIDQEESQKVYQQIIDAGVAVKNEVTINTNIFTRLRYMRDTEEEADEAAFWFMEKNGYDPIHFINFLKRQYDTLPDNLKKHSEKNEKYSDHPDIPKRIKKLEWLYKKYHGKELK